MKYLSCLSLLLVIIGALNWGLWGFFQFDLVAWLAGGNTNGLARLIYSLVGLGGVWSLSFLGKWKHLCCCSHEHKGGGCCK